MKQTAQNKAESKKSSVSKYTKQCTNTKTIYRLCSFNAQKRIVGKKISLKFTNVK